MQNKSCPKATLYALFLALALSVPTAALAVMTSNDWVKGVHRFKFLAHHPRIAGVSLAVLDFALLFLVSRYLLRNLSILIEKSNEISVPSFLSLSFNTKSVLKGLLVLLLCWLPIVILMFPGATTGGDTINQLYQFFAAAPTFRGFSGDFVDAEFINDSPLMDTLLFGSAITVGRFFNSDTLGVFFYCFSQMVLTALAFSLLVCYSEKLSTTPLLRASLLLSIGFCPMIPVFAYAMVKDSLFSVFFLLYSIEYVEVVRTEGEAFKSPLFLVLFVLVSLLCALSKTTGMYAIFPSDLLLFIYLKRQRIQAALCTIATYAIYAMVIPRLLFPMLDVYTPLSSAGVPGSHIVFQQIVTTLIDDPDALSDEDRASLERVMDIDQAIELYDPRRTDAVTRSVIESEFNDDSAKVMQIWVKLGFTHPVSYLKSVLKCTVGAFVPTYVFNQDVYIYQNAIDFYSEKASSTGTSFDLDAENPALLSSIVQDCRAFLINTIGAVPGLSLLVSYGLYGGWIPLICTVFCFYYDKRSIAGLAPILVTSLLLLVIPILYARYVTPSLYISYVAIVWVLYIACRSTKAQQ